MQYEEPTEAVQALRERLEVQRMLRCTWLRGMLQYTKCVCVHLLLQEVWLGQWQ